MMLYIMYFPVYRKERDYNNFTSAHSWPVITLRVWRFLWIFLSLSFPSKDGDSFSLNQKSRQSDSTLI